MMKWTRPEILNAVRELSRFMTGATRAHMTAIYRVMKYCVGTPNRGMFLKPNGKWDGDPDFEFVIAGRSDSERSRSSQKCKWIFDDIVWSTCDDEEPNARMCHFGCDIG